ncbi:hypothetical protein BH23BAC1_BH23BAC1_11700 [soil metagenome]
MEELGEEIIEIHKEIRYGTFEQYPEEKINFLQL